MEADPPRKPLRPVDYNHVQHRNYARGRVMSDEAIRRWTDVFAGHLPARRPLTGIDLGSGTGRFTPGLADAFGGPVYGVEPAEPMRRAAEAGSAHPQVTYLAGRGEAIPRPDASADFLLAFLSWHHYADKPAAAREIARVLKAGGRFFMRTTHGDRVPDIWWRRYFPGTWDVERAMFASEAETRAIVEAAGLRTLASLQVETAPERDFPAAVARLKLKPYSVFEHLTEDELAEGFARLDADLRAGVLADKPASGSLLVFGAAP